VFLRSSSGTYENLSYADSTEGKARNISIMLPFTPFERTTIHFFSHITSCRPHHCQLELSEVPQGIFVLRWHLHVVGIQLVAGGLCGLPFNHLHHAGRPNVCPTYAGELKGMKTSKTCMAVRTKGLQVEEAVYQG